MTFRLGLVGLCTSHPRRWVPIIRQLSAERGLEIEVTVAWDSGEVQPAGFAQQFCREMGIPRVVENLADMIELVDVVIVHTANWDQHVEQAAPFVDADKAVLIDKPIVGNLRDAEQLRDWIAAGKRITGGSSLRFALEIREFVAQPDDERGELHTAFGGTGTDEFFYGIHAYAMLCGLMGPGVRSVEHLGSTRQRLLRINWNDGKAGLLSIGGASKLPFHITAVSTTGVAQIEVDPTGIYRALLEQCLPYLCGHAEASPLPTDVILEPELAALAAQRSWLAGGGEVLLTDLDPDDPGYDGATLASEYRRSKSVSDKSPRPLGEGEGCLMFDNNRYTTTVRTILDEFALGSPARIDRLGGTATLKFAAETGVGRFVVRVRPEEFAEEGMVQFDHDVLRRLAAQDMPVPCPQERPGGTTWLRLGGRVVEVLSWIEGEPFRWDDLESLRNVGRFLARFHAALIHDIPPGKEAFLREDHPDLLMPYVEQVKARCRTSDQRASVERIGEQIELVRREYDGKLRPQLPMAVIHGDIHPGNVMFRGSQVAAVYDFDYLSVEARVRDLCDALMFFASRHDAPLDPDDIHSLTQPFRFDLRRWTVLIGGYQDVNRLEDREWQAIPLIVRSLWIQNRLRGSRKVPQEERLPFVLHRCFDVIQWLDQDATGYLERLRKRLEDDINREEPCRAPEA